jgi:predicted MFS family arabinose efflux permease
MLSVTGLGAIIGSLFVASRTEYRRPGLALAASLAGFGVALLVMGVSRWLPLTLLALVVAGSQTVIYNTLTNTLMLSATPPELHGRVVSLLSLDRGIIPLGALLAGLLAERLGAGPAMSIMAIILLVLAGVATILLVPSLNQITPHRAPRQSLARRAQG